MIADLEAELARVRDQQRLLSARAYHLGVALLKARQGTDPRIIAATLAAKGITVAPLETVGMGA